MRALRMIWQRTRNTAATPVTIRMIQAAERRRRRRLWPHHPVVATATAALLGQYGGTEVASVERAWVLGQGCLVRA